MSYLKISVNEQSVTYDDWFIFTIDISFSGLYAPLRPVLLTTFIPNTIDYLLPSINPPLVAIKEEPVSNGTNITFDYGTIDNTGLTISFPLKCRFNLKADDTTTFILGAVLYINSTTEPTFKASSPPVSLEVEPYYVLTMNTVVPNGTSAAAGGSIIYELSWIIQETNGNFLKTLKWSLI